MVENQNNKLFVSGVILGALLSMLSISAAIISVPQYESKTNIVCNISMLDMQAAFANALGNPNSENTAQTNDAWIPSNTDNFAKCMTSKGLKFYGASWCPHCTNMKTLFGSSMQYINYIECETGDNTMTQECINAGITGFPTFKIGTQTLVGEQTLKQLSDATGCV